MLCRLEYPALHLSAVRHAPLAPSFTAQIVILSFERVSRKIQLRLRNVPVIHRLRQPTADETAIELSPGGRIENSPGQTQRSPGYVLKPAPITMLECPAAPKSLHPAARPPRTCLLRVRHCKTGARTNTEAVLDLSSANTISALQAASTLSGRLPSGRRRVGDLPFLWGSANRRPQSTRSNGSSTQAENRLHQK